MKNIANLGICIPSRSEWPADFALCLLQLVLTIGKHPLPGYKQTGVMVLNERGSILPQLRRKLAESAIAKGCTHLLWIDSDQLFPNTLAHQLISHDADVIACNIATKSIPANPTARLFDEKAPDEGKALYARLDAKHGDLVEVWRVGFGVMLTKAEIFSKLPKPWFSTGWSEARNEEIGEDWFFCDLLHKAGIPIFVDEYLSGAIGHIGNYTYSHDDVELPAAEPKIVLTH